MNLFVGVSIGALFFVLLFGFTAFLFKKAAKKQMSPAAVKFTGLVGSILIFGLFVLLMGLVKYLQRQ